MTKLLIKMAVWAAVVLVVGAAGVIVWRQVTANRTIEQLLKENDDLKSAIANLTEERQIGYAKVLSQETREGKLYTRLLFVEADPADFTKQLLRKEYEIEGDVVHFDALIVTFGGELVKGGTEKAMYLWRRVYGEKMPPEQGFPIEEPGQPSPRYMELSVKLSVQDQKLFWDEIWSLSNNPKRLEQLGIKAVYGNVVYRQLKPGLIYVFKISSTGTLYPEIIPDL
ncbi:MAG: hypothetical protein LLF76_09705 [Planctomycetaceae bacterium]|nr:hypothetical protein [Planctomycetaceae bacterium]